MKKEAKSKRHLGISLMPEREGLMFYVCDERLGKNSRGSIVVPGSQICVSREEAREIRNKITNLLF